MKSLLIVISGFSCTGKTTLGRQLSQELSLPFISRDDLKESLFDSLGWKDREWSKRLGIASYKLLYYFIESQLSVGRSLAVESNFKPEFDTDKFLQLKNQYKFEPIQIYCKTEPTILFQRFKSRFESGQRHPGHIDNLNYEEFQTDLIKGGSYILDIGGKVFEIDTTDFEKIDYKILFEEIKLTALARG